MILKSILQTKFSPTISHTVFTVWLRQPVTLLLWNVGVAKSDNAESITMARNKPYLLEHGDTE